MSKSRILIIAGESPTRRELEDRLEDTGCEVLIAGDGEQGVRRALQWSPEVVLVGSPLPGSDMLEVCRLIRAGSADTNAPLILLIPEIQSENGSIARSLDLHQFAQAMRTLSGSTGPKQGHRIEYDGLLIDRLSYRVLVDQTEVNLTLTEFNLLWALAQCPGKVWSRRQLTERCRGEGRDVRDRTIDAHIKSVRRKLGHGADLIQTVRGVGYRLRHSRAAASVG